ncbi:MAG TPA: ATP-dependent helicase [Bacilli bacterium]|nr:ATP-dependent helicase [Bacilli bacterium]
MKFNDNQIKAINHYTGNCCVLASAGSGKTSVLTHRIVNLINTYKVNPENILAITFSKKAKDNMKERIGNMLGNTGDKITIETFHALGYKLLRESKYINFNGIIETWKQKQIIADILIKQLHIEDSDRNIDINNILRFISYQKNNLIEADNKLIQLNNMPYGISVMKNIYQLYESAKRKEHKLDFDDLLLYTYNLLYFKDKEREKYQNRYQFICVDEFQDTNYAQYEILRLLGKKYNNVFVVGDPLQNIYEWNLANNDYLINFYKDWTNTTVIPLDTNYRCTQNIVDISNKLVKGIKETTHEHYYKANANKSKYKMPEFTCYENEYIESDSIAKKIIELGCDYSEVAILTRTNFQTQAIERGLYNNNIPYEVIGNTTFYEQKEIKDMIAFLRLIDDTNNDEAFKTIYNTPNRYLGTVFLNEISVYSKQHRVSLYDSMLYFPRSHEWRYKNGIDEIKGLVNKLKRRKKYKVGDLIEIIRNYLDYDNYISKEKYENNDRNEKIDNLNTLVTIANKYKSIKEFLEEVDNILGFAKNSNIKNKVKIMTIHKAKGLEFPIVFIPSVNNLFIPHAKSENEDEERRLFYVALTRAEKELYISSTLTYNNRDMDISPFIYDIFDLVQKTTI